MIKFFRSIRQKLHSENKFSKYLLYAIGEIILVVIGILIALQINTWNTQIKDQKEERTLLSNLKQEIENNLLLVNQSIIAHSEIQKACIELTENMGPQPEIKSAFKVDSLLSTIMVSPRFNYSNGVMQSIINSGSLGLVKNDTIRYKIAELPSIIKNGTNTESTLREISWNKLLPLMEKEANIKNALMSSSFFKNSIATSPSSKFESKTQEVLSNPEMENHIFSRAAITMVAISELSLLKNELEGLVSLIEKELENKRQ